MDGIILINKEKGMTSHDVVSKLRKILNTKKVGHAGTLDPMATGILPILVGKGTKLSKYLMEHDKEYIATIKLGEKTETGDCEGKIIETASYNVEEEYLLKVLNSFRGKQIQIPPIYSAIKVNGKKLYEYARSGETVEIPEREIEIYDINLEEFKENIIKFRVSCSKGTYIRSLCNDIAVKLGTVGTMIDLIRTKVNNFVLSESVLINNVSKEDIISIEKVFGEKEVIKLDDRNMQMFLNGMPLDGIINEELCLVYDKDMQFIGVGKNDRGRLIRDVVIKE